MNDDFWADMQGPGAPMKKGGPEHCINCGKPARWRYVREGCTTIAYCDEHRDARRTSEAENKS